MKSWVGPCLLGILMLLTGNTKYQSVSGRESGSGSGTVELSDPRCGYLVDLVLVVQSSSEIGLENYDNLREAVTQVISFYALESSDGFCVWVIVYGAESKVEIPQTCERNSAIGQANFLNLPSESGSVAGEAIELMRTQFASSTRANSAAKLAVILSSVPPDDQVKFEAQISLARNDNVRILAVAIGGQTGDIFPNVVADKFLFVESYQSLNNNPSEIQNTACELPGYCSTSSASLVANPIECSSFLVCLRLPPPFPPYLVLQCPEGLLFNRQIGVCDFPWFSRCLVDSCFENEFGNVPAIGGCSRSWACRNGRTLENACCRSGERFEDGQGCVADASCTTECMSILATIVPLTPEPGCDRSAVNNYPDWFVESSQFFTCDYGKVFDSTLCECISRSE